MADDKTPLGQPARIVPRALDEDFTLSDTGNLPGTQRAQEVIDAKLQRGFFNGIWQGMKDTVIGDAVRLAQDELAPTLMSLSGYTPDELGDYSDQYERLTTGIPSQYHSDILDEPTLAGAERASARTKYQLERAYEASRQQGLSPNLAYMAGSFLDVDAPLTFMTGGGYKAAQLARRSLILAEKAGLGAKAALRSTSGIVGASAGLQAGLVVGLAQTQVKETADWTTVAENAMMGMLLGGGGAAALNAERALGVRAAQDELHSRIARNDPTLNDLAPVNPAAAERLHAPDHTAPEGPAAPDQAPVDAPALDAGTPSDTAGVASDGTLSARSVNPNPGVLRTPIVGNLSDAGHDIATMADNWRHESGWYDWKIAEHDEWWAKVALSGVFNVTTDNWRTLYKSNSSVLNWMLGNVFESPNGMGRGRYTAAAGMEAYHRQIAGKFVAPLEEATKDWARRNGATAFGQARQESIRKFNREVMLELNDRHLGRSTPRDPAVMKAADALEEAGETARRIGQGEQGQLSIDGFENLPTRRGYSPQHWNGATLNRLERDGVVTRADVVDALSKAYRVAGMSATKDAHAVAKAVVDRAMAKGDDVNMSLVSLLNGDGREWLESALMNSGLPKAEADGLMKRLVGAAEERGKEGFAKSRNDLDLNHPIRTQDGSELRIVDLLDQDLHHTWQKYTRKLSGAAAMARVGLTNRIKREEFIAAAQAQQRGLGEDVVPADLLRAMLSNFDGGPVHGFSSFLGGHYYERGVMAEAALVKRMTNLSLLGKLGFAQLAETGAGIAATGLENWITRGPMQLLHAEIKRGNKQVLDDLAFMVGSIGEDHKLFAEHLDLDEMHATDRGWFMNGAQRLSQKATHLQGYVSGFNTVRGVQQQIVASAITDKIFRAIKKEVERGSSVLTDEGLRTRMRADLGLFDEDFTALFKLVEDGTVQFGNVKGREFVDRLNPDQWDVETRAVFGAAITRNMNQIVQKSMAGESDAWMHTTVGSLLTHLKTFPLQAMQKQFIRNARHSDAQTLNTLFMGMSTAALAITVRDAIDGKERTAAETAKLAFGYSNLTGWIPMVTDPTATLLGLEDYRINQYGPHNDYTPATVTWANKASRLPGAVIDTVTGQADYQDKQAIKALPFANIVGLHRILD